MVKIKFCGMTNLDDCKKAVDLSVEFIGFVFYNKSRRYITPLETRRIIEKLDDSVSTVGVFIGETDEEIEKIVDYCDLDFAQVYRESAVKKKITAYRVADHLPASHGEGLILFDSYTEGYGGSGTAFHFGLLENCEVLNRTFIAGGINEQNVREILRLQPFGVDLVSSVERYKGKKDHKKMERLVKTIRSIAS
jgi:phosphoribosylanthranilate isomerase